MRKTKQDLIVNIFSFGLVSLLGVVINLVLARNYTVTQVGQFSYLYSVVIIFSQFSSFGLHYSSLRYLSENGSDKTSILTNGFILCIFTGLLFSLLFFLFGITVSEFPREWVYVFVATFGLFFFSINKYLLFSLNGLERMRGFAVFNFSRYALTFLWLVFGTFIYKYPNAEYFISSLILVPEIVLFVLLLFQIKTLIVFSSISREILKRHLNFGSKGLWSGALTELNAKVDVIIITHFMGAYHAGIYSLASMIFEGVSQLPTVFRNLLNPKITQLCRDGNKLQKEIKFYSLLCLVSVTVLGLICLVIYPYYVQHIVQNMEYLAGFVPVVILVAGVVISAYLSPLQMFLMQIGQPGRQSILLGTSVLLNLVLNFALIPKMGITGAAVATAVVTVVISLLNYLIIKKYFQKRE